MKCILVEQQVAYSAMEYLRNGATYPARRIIVTEPDGFHITPDDKAIFVGPWSMEKDMVVSGGSINEEALQNYPEAEREKVREEMKKRFEKRRRDFTPKIVKEIDVPDGLVELARLKYNAQRTLEAHLEEIKLIAEQQT